MNFNSATFALFIAVVAALYVLTQVTRRRRLQNLMLLAASYFFYGAWDHRFLFLIVLSTAIDFTAGLGIVGRSPSTRAWWAMGGLLGVSSVVLCAPADWAGIGSAMLPADA